MTRKMGDFDVLQRTKDYMFNATGLLKQWNKATGMKKEIGHFFENQSTNEFIEAIMEDENFKHRNSAYLKTRGKYGGTWMHPYLFIDFSMWLDPKFKLEVIRFVYDQLVEQRTTAGDNYIKLSASGATLSGYDFREVAIAMQYIVFGTKGKGLRQLATQEQLKELNKIQENLSFAIDMGYITEYEDLMSEMRKLYNKKYSEKLLNA